jgi:hypothetical protein
VSPPEREGPGPSPGTGPNHKALADTTTNTADLTALAQLRTRRQASYRLAPLDCGCRDPWPCRCTQPPLSEHALESWRVTAEYLLATAGMPVVPIEVRRAWWRRGGRDRALAERLHRGCGGAVT